MKIASRFGPIEVDPEDVLHFPDGLIGLEDARRWVLLADQRNDAVAWLQSVDRPDAALPVVSPRRFVPGYQMRVARRELAPLELDEGQTPKVLVVLGRTARGLSLDLKAPLLLNFQGHVGRQVITNGELPVRYELASPVADIRKIA